jgi:hypothetical protein
MKAALKRGGEMRFERAGGDIRSIGEAAVGPQSGSSGESDKVEAGSGGCHSWSHPSKV